MKSTTLAKKECSRLHYRYRSFGRAPYSSILGRNVVVVPSTDREKQVPEASSIHIDLGFSAPYFDLPLLRSGIPSKSLTPRIQWDFTPGKSFTLPPLIKTIECSCKLWPSPGMWANISCRLLNRTLTILRRAEFGFLGVLVETRRHTPCFWGHWSKARVRSVRRFSSLPSRINWFNVGIRTIIWLMIALPERDSPGYAYELTLIGGFDIVG